MAMVSMKNVNIYPTREEKIAIMRAVQDYLINKALELKFTDSADKLVVRDLRPSDLDLGTEEWSFDLSGGTANAYNVVVNNYEVPDNKLIVIYGIRLHGDSNTKIVRFWLGDTVLKAYWDIHALASFTDNERKEVIVTSLEEAIEYRPNDKVKVEFLITAAGTEPVELMGYIVELKSGSEAV